MVSRGARWFISFKKPVSLWELLWQTESSNTGRKFNIYCLPMHSNEDEVFLIAYMSASNKLIFFVCLFVCFLALPDINECEREPCKNGGICTDLVANYSCECPGEYMGRNCQSSKCSCSYFNWGFFVVFNTAIHSYSTLDAIRTKRTDRPKTVGW